LLYFGRKCGSVLMAFAALLHPTKMIAKFLMSTSEFVPKGNSPGHLCPKRELGKGFYPKSVRMVEK